MNRPYRPALGIDAALDEIAKNKSILYDPEVVDACLQIFNEKGYKLVDWRLPSEREQLLQNLGILHFRKVVNKIQSIGFTDIICQPCGVPKMSITLD